MAQVTATFHASGSLRFVCHRALANHCGFTLMLYHESLRDYAKASVANRGRYWPSSDGEALWNLANPPAVMYAESTGLWSRSTWGYACLLAYTNGMG